MTMAAGTPWSIFRYEKGDTQPTLTVPGETIVWERGAGQGEFYKDSSTWSNCYEDRYYGNTFTFGTTIPDGDFLIDTITILGYRLGSPGICTIEFKEVDGDGKPTGSVLTSGTFNSNIITTSTDGELIEVTITPYTFKASTQYAWYVKAGGGSDINNRFNPRYKSSGTYTGGTYISTFNAGGSWSVFSTNDFYFDIQGAGFFLLVNDNNNVVRYATLKTLP